MKAMVISKTKELLTEIKRRRVLYKKYYLLFAIFLMCGNLLAEAGFTTVKPNFIVMDPNGIPVPNVSGSISELSAVSKVSQLPKGVKYLIARRTPLEVTFDTVEITEPEICVDTPEQECPSDNIPPVADAGEDKTCAVGQRCYLDHTKSSDPDGTIVSHKYTQVSGTPVEILYDDIKGKFYFIAPQAVSKEKVLAKYFKESRYKLTSTN